MAQQVYSSIYIPRQKFGRYSIQLLRTSSYLLYLLTYADLRHTNCLIFAHIRPVRRHGLSHEQRPHDFRPQLISIALLPSSRRTYQLSSHAGLTTYNFHPPFRNFQQINTKLSIIFPQALLFHCDWATRTTTLSYSVITYTSTQTSLLVYLGLEQSPANP